MEPDQRRHVVDDLAAGNERAHVRDDAGDFEIRGKARKVLRVAPDGAQHQRHAAALRIEYPAEAIVLRAILDACREPALDVFDLHQVDPAQVAVANQRARIAGHRVGGVGVRDREQAAVLPRARHQVAGLREIVRHRLVADDVESRIQCRRRKRIVRVVRRHDRHGVDAVGAKFFLRQHVGHVAVAACRVESHRGAGCSGAAGIAGKYAGDRAPPAIHFRSAAMHATDPGVGPAADDPQPQGPPEPFAQTHRVPL